jgi:hypothetical protein
MSGAARDIATIMLPSDSIDRRPPPSSRRCARPCGPARRSSSTAARHLHERRRRARAGGVLHGAEALMRACVFCRFSGPAPIAWRSAASRSFSTSADSVEEAPARLARRQEVSNRLHPRGARVNYLSG